KVVTTTPAGGFLMGNPNAAVKLVEYGSMTCPHCAEFEETGTKPLLEQYVKTGKVSFEFRNYVRDVADLAASLVARCGGTASFFPLTRALYADQRNWSTRIQSSTPEQQQALSGLPPTQQFGAIAKLAGFPQWAAMRGLPSAKSAACLANEAEINRLVQMNSDATSQYPNFPGTPSFTINGELLDKTASWSALEPQLKAAVGG
ncbi:MAG: thioredoxin domain-containing protein, partial [Sphingomicrobium sp.]